MCYRVTMNKQNNVTNNVTWLPRIHSVHWVDDETQVPVWDVSRGVNPNDYEERFDWEVVRRTFRLTDGKLAAQLAKERGWGAEEAPKGGYPRLVASLPVVEPYKPPEEKVINAVTRLTRYADKPNKLKEQVLQLASTYGLLNRAGRRNSLNDWLETAKEMRWLLDLAEVLRGEMKKPVAEQGSAAEALDAARPPSHLHLNPKYRFNGDERFFSIYLYLARFFKDSEAFADLFGSEALRVYEPVRRALENRVPRTVKDLQSVLCEYFSEKFDKRVVTKLVNGQTTHRHDCLTEMYKELAEAFSDGLPLRRCPNCSTAFVPRNRRQEFCDAEGKNRCRMAYKRRVAS